MRTPSTIAKPAAAPRTSSTNRGSPNADDFQDEIDREDDQSKRDSGDRHGDDRDRGRQRPSDDARNGPPRVERIDPRRLPEAFIVPEVLGTVDGGEERADRADAAAADDVDLDAGFVQGPEHAGMIGAGRAGADEDQRRAALR
jgi:hypothetical protein